MTKTIATVGRIVHFYHKDRVTPFAAVITHVHNDQSVNLHIFPANTPDDAYLVSVWDKTRVILDAHKNGEDIGWEWPAKV